MCKHWFRCNIDTIFGSASCEARAWIFYVTRLSQTCLIKLRSTEPSNFSAFPRGSEPQDVNDGRFSLLKPVTAN